MDLRHWLRGLGLEQYAAIFRENAIDDAVLPSFNGGGFKGPESWYCRAPPQAARRHRRADQGQEAYGPAGGAALGSKNYAGSHLNAIGAPWRSGHIRFSFADCCEV
jgi:hypothetical protein